MSNSIAVSQEMAMKHFWSPKTVIGRLVTRHTIRGAILWALVFSGYFASKSIGLVDVYPTTAARLKIAQSYGNNIGIEFLIGSARHVTAAAGSIAAWNTIGIMVIVGSIWGLLLATKYFRGEEDSGRWEILFSGQTTARRAAMNIFAGIGLSLVVFYAIMAGLFMVIGKSRGVDFSASAGSFFALGALSGAVIFIMIGALASQLMPTRSQATTVSAVVFGVMFLMRAIADVTSAHWLLNLTPLGWIEKLQPLSSDDPVWLLPIGGLVIALGALTIFFAGKRDYEEGIFADKDTAKPRTRLLNSPLGAATRLMRANGIGWLVGIFATAILYGLLTKSAAQEFSQSANASHVITRLAHQSQAAGVTAFLGVIFLLIMAILMGYAASAIAAIRRDEAQNYLDNYLVQPFSRLRWLSGRIFLISVVVLSAGLLTLVGVWLGTASQHIGSV